MDPAPRVAGIGVLPAGDRTEESVTALGQLASGLAHELGKPLTAILRNAEAAELQLNGPRPDLDELREIVSTMTEAEIDALKRGGHDFRKLHAAFDAATRHKERPTVILAKTKKGFGMGQAGDPSDLYQQAVQAARAEFPDRVWQMFWRLTADGRPAPQVAEEFGMTPAAVRQAKSRVLRRLKQLVGDLPD